MGFSFVVAVWITGPRFALTKNFFDMLRRWSPTLRTPLIWDLAPHFGLTGRPKFPLKRSKRLQHSPCHCGHMFFNIAGYTTKTLFTKVFISRETRGRCEYV
jgi:hypothetical protein